VSVFYENHCGLSLTGNMLW